MASNKYISNLILLPLSKLYGFGVWVRALLYKWNIFKRKSFDIPVVVIGNLAVGGTGKTPHTEYVARLLRNNFNPAILSRGYKRKTHGFILADEHSTPGDIGDEPYQMYHKFNRMIPVAVCENRVAGIERLRQIDPSINLILLDDAYQHRAVKPDVSIVLTEFKRPVFYDSLMPHGRLREPMSAIYGADIVVVSKCPDELRPLDFRLFKKNLNLFPTQKLVFSRYRYENPVPLFPQKAVEAPHLEYLNRHDSVLIVCGIANPHPFVRHIKQYNMAVKLKTFADHHNFSRRDMETIQSRFDALEGRHKYIITTEKDAVRLLNNPYYPPELKPYTFYIPITVVFDHNVPDNFDESLKRLIASKASSARQNKNETNP